MTKTLQRCVRRQIGALDTCSRLLLGFLLCVPPATSACRLAIESDSTDLVITHQVSPQPPKVGPATVILTLANKAGTPVSGAKVVLEGNMTHAGMPPIHSEAHETEPGRYEGPLDFKMSGDWVITVRMTLADGRALTREFEVSKVNPE